MDLRDTWSCSNRLQVAEAFSRPFTFFRCRKEDGAFGTASFHMGVSENGGTQQPLVFLLNMILLGCFGGTTDLRKHPVS